MTRRNKIPSMLLICMLLSVLIACSASTSPSSVVDAVSSDIQTELSSVTGTPLTRAGLNARVIEASGIYDPNVADPESHGVAAIASVPNGQHTEVSLQFANNLIVAETLPVFSVQEFFINKGDPKKLMYEIETDIVAGTIKAYGYNEISDKLVYSDTDILVVDISSFLQIDYRDKMQKYIADNEGNIFGHPPLIPQNELPLLADGTLIYKYDWMSPAFDYITEHKAEIIIALSH